MRANESEVQVRDRRVPGLGHLFQLRLPDGAMASVFVKDGTGDRELDLLEAGDDEPRARISLPHAYAETLAALLSGLRLVFDDDLDSGMRTGVQVKTMVIGPSSPAIGQAVADVEIPTPEDARILAVIRDDTPELLELDKARKCQPGDRLVLAGRPGPMEQLRRFLAG